MFTGIITSIGTIESAEQQGDLRLKIACDYKADSMQTGDSIAVNGTCLTVTGKGFSSAGKPFFTTSLSQETVTRTATGQWEKGRKVNLERALKMGDTLDGHLVTGHVDGIAAIKSMTTAGDSHIMTIKAPEGLSKFIAEKGSVTLDGVSLTVNKVKGHEFEVNIIHHTWQNTTFAERKEDDGLNLEIDVIARYVARLMQ